MARDKSLDPVLPSERNLTCPKFTLSWASDVIAVFIFMNGAGALAAGLNVVQALAAVSVAMLLNIIPLVGNGIPGTRYGIPMIVQLRPCFGDKAADYVAAIRAFPSIMWCGYQSFLGAIGLNLFSIILFGFDNVWLWFVVFHFTQVILSTLGMKKILNFAAYAAVALFVICMVMGCYVFYLYDPRTIIEQAVTGGSWGRPFWIVVGANISLCITIMLNASDYTREVRTTSNKAMTVCWAVGLIPTVLILSGLGMVIYLMSGIWSPLDLFVKYVPTPFLAALSIAFIILGQFSTNMFANMLPNAVIFKNLFKCPSWFAAVINGCLAMFVLPWFLTTSDGFYTFMNSYGALMGPLAGILFVDYLFIRKQKYNIRELYHKGGQYSYKDGVNWAGIITVVISAIPAMIWMNYSTPIGLVISLFLYPILYRAMVLPHYPQAEMAPDYVEEDLAAVKASLDD